MATDGGASTKQMNMETSDQQKAIARAQRKAEKKAAFEAQRANLKEDKPKEAVQKSKAQLRAERRALQEAQRAAKSSKKDDTKSDEKLTGNDKIRELNATSAEKLDKKSIHVTVGDTAKNDSLRAVDSKNTEGMKKIKVQTKSKLGVQKHNHLFSHLLQHHFDITEINSFFISSEIHPAVVRVGLQMAQGIIRGSSERCIAMLLSLKKVIKDYSTPECKELARDLENKIQPNVNFLQQCRPLSVSMENALKALKFDITHISPDMKDIMAKRNLCENIDKFIEFDIILAKKAISEKACEKIRNGDVVLTFGFSSLVKQVVVDAHKCKEKKFRVIVADARPKFEGREMLRCLIKEGIHCTYVLINAVSYVMKEVTKVLLGSHSVLADDSVMSHMGSSQIALVAHSYNIPVIVCSETYKFCESAYTDSFANNELADSQELVTKGNQVYIENWKEISSLHVLNPLYDVTPPNLVAMIISEKKGILFSPCAPAVHRYRELKKFNNPIINSNK